LVCGGRQFEDETRLIEFLNYLHKQSPISCIIQGGARGADQMAGRWAWKNGVSGEQYDADWDQYGASAGAIRNRIMLEIGKPDLVVAFPGGKGTANMVSQAKTRQVNVIEV
jgi:hypothetical protein